MSLFVWPRTSEEAEREELERRDRERRALVAEEEREEYERRVTLENEEYEQKMRRESEEFENRMKIKQEQTNRQTDDSNQEDTSFMHKLELQRILMELKLKEIKRIEQKKRYSKIMKAKQNTQTNEIQSKNDEKTEKNLNIKFKKWLCCF